MIDRRKVIQEFQNYVSSYNPSDPKIKLKIDHTYRVATLCARIAASIGEEEDLAWLCGMLHDIGRFEQVKRYNSVYCTSSIICGS